MLASIDVNRHASYGYDQRVEVFGSKGMIQAENRLPTTTLVSTADGLGRPTIEPSFPTRYREAYRIELEAFLRCVSDDAPPSITREDVEWNNRLAEAAERSHRTGQPVRLDS